MSTPRGAEAPAASAGRGRGVAGPAAAAALVAALAWWVTGLRPFTATAYAAVAATIVLVSVVDLAWGVPRGPAGRLAPLGRRPLTPLVAIAAAAVVLEAVGLALGGRSATVPTLSTVVDHALASHAARLAVFVAWLAVGAAPALRRLARRA